MVLNAAVQMLREADELKQKILKFKSGTSMLQDRSLWVTQQQLQKVYQKVLVLDLDYALEKKVEQDLWNVGFKQQIEALQAISKDRKNPLRSEGQAMLSWVLQAAAGFYLCLLHQICTAFKLDLPFRRRASLLGWVEGWGAGEGTPTVGAPPAGAARYICQHCLVHLGDLARYRQQLKVAHTFYRHALVVSAHSGQPYNQLALVAWRRGRRLGALYWHVRSALVRAPFPPAHANLARTLHAAASGGLSHEGVTPVLPGLTVPPGPDSTGTGPATRLDAHAYVTELIRAMHMIHTVEQLDTAEKIVNNLNLNLPILVAADSFEPMTLVKMACVLIWLVQSSSEGYQVGRGAMSTDESRAAALAERLAAAAALALLLGPPEEVPPALVVWLQWAVGSGAGSGAALGKGAVWPALANLLTRLAEDHRDHTTNDDSVPLPEDEELQGFLPLEEAHRGVRFDQSAWDTYAGRLPTPNNADPQGRLGVKVSQGREGCVRAHRVLAAGRRLAELRPECLTHAEEAGVSVFSANCGVDELAAVVSRVGAGLEPGPDAGVEADGDDEPPPPPPPVVISEADFREKVREKRVGILKPQGSLERARIERAANDATADPHTDSDGGDDNSKGDDKKETRKPRVNIAMAAIMRKQEETNKQVKFVTPPPTPESAADSTESKEQEKPKVIQPKAMKGLTALPLGRKTGGILSLKDKSAGYPHLVNTDPEPPKKTEKDEKKEPKPVQGSSQGSQTSYQQKRQDAPTSPKWPAQQNTYENPRMNFQKNYGIQNAGVAFNPSYPAQSQGIRLPVVNPKEIDVRTAALQKQTSRQDVFQDGNKFTYSQMSGDKKNFLNDLPPRFANQYRYWQTAHENQYNDNKFRDDTLKQTAFNAPWQPESFAQPPWWKPDQPPPNYNANFAQPNFYSHLTSNVPFQNVPFNQMNQALKPEMSPNYLQTSVAQPPIQSVVSSPNFNSSMNSYGTYAPTVGYDSAMYPQFNKLGFQPLGFAPKDPMDMGLHGFGSNAGARNFKFNDRNDNAAKNLDQSILQQPGETSGEASGNTYSLFSGAPDSAWPPQHTQQSLWSGPGPSPLERLLEQQKQMKPPQ